MAPKHSKSFGDTRAFRAHVLAGHGVSQEVRDLRADVEEGFQNNEARASFPHLDWLDISAGALLAAGGDVTLMGRNLLQGQTFENSLVFGTGAAAVTLDVLKPGDTGWKVKIVQGTALTVLFQDRLTGAVTFTNGSKAVTGVGTLFKTQLKKGDKIKRDADSIWATVDTIIDDLNLTLTANYADVGGAGDASEQTLDMLVIRLAVGSTANQVKAAIDAAYPGIIFATSGGAGVVVPVTTPVPFTGGTGLFAGNKIWVGGVEVPVKHALPRTWEDAKIVVTTPAGPGPGMAVGDLVNVMISSDGVTSETLTGVLA